MSGNPVRGSEHAYRPDIDGLRAIAVSSVLMFHAFPDVLPGGFVGVDVFFVISGYLISKILLGEIQRRRFSLWRFYERRVRRIFPALLLVLAVTLLFGRILLLKGELQQLSRSALWGLLSAGNLKNLKGTGYFDSAGDLAPTWHLWSLGVEEQFYLVWPLLLWLACRGQRADRRLLALLCAAMALSFLLNVRLVASHPTAAFYLPVTRMWQLAAGGFLASRELVSERAEPEPARLTSRASNLLAALAVVMLGASFALIDPQRAFPGYWALLPTLGAASAIGAGPRAWLNRNVLGSRPLVWLGLISYPLYLWHWPLLSFARIITPRAVPALLLSSLLALATLLAWLTYRFLERPIRAAKGSARPVWALLAGAGALAAVAEALFLGVIPARARPSTALAERGYARNFELRSAFHQVPCDTLLEVEPRIRPFCSIVDGPPGAPTLAIWGDSHAENWSPALFQLAKDRGYRVLVISHTGCAPLLHVRHPSPLCHEECRTFGLGEAALRTIFRAKPRQIYLVARWPLYAHGPLQHGRLVDYSTFLSDKVDQPADLASSRAALEANMLPTLQALQQIAPVTLVRTVPELTLPYEAGCARDAEHFERTLAEHRRLNEFTDRIIDDAVRQVGGVRVLDPAPLLCRERCMATLGGELLYTDDNHLTAQAAQLFEAELSPKL